jgi:hypothetical protein
LVETQAEHPELKILAETDDRGFLVEAKSSAVNALKLGMPRWVVAEETILPEP